MTTQTIVDKVLSSIKEILYCIGGAIVLTFGGAVLCLVLVYYILWILVSFVLAVIFFGVCMLCVLVDTILVEIAHFFSGKKKD